MILLGEDLKFSHLSVVSDAASSRESSTDRKCVRLLISAEKLNRRKGLCIPGLGCWFFIFGFWFFLNKMAYA